MSLSPFDLNPRHLRAISAIIAKGSMNAAAEAVGISQPALTQGIAKLEQQLRATIFERHAGGMSPTSEGLLLADRSEAAFAHLAAAIPRRARRGFSKPELLMTGAQLRAFLSLADAGGFARAARASNVSQPALHRAVREMEQVCGYSLVERRGRGVMLTARGHRLARGVRLAGAELTAAIADICGERAASSITIGAMPGARPLVLPRAIARFTPEFPRVRIDVVEGSWRELIDPLIDGILDLTVGAMRSAPPAGVTQFPLFVDELAVIARAGHPLRIQAKASLDELASYPWIVGQAATPRRAQWEALFAGRELPPAPIECGSVTVVRQILRESDFLTVLSPDQVELEIAGSVLGTVGPPLPDSKRTVGITTRADWRPSTAQRRFVELLNAAAGVPENQ